MKKKILAMRIRFNLSQFFFSNEDSDVFYENKILVLWIKLNLYAKKKKVLEDFNENKF